MGGSGDPAQINIIWAHGAHGPDSGQTLGGRTRQITFFLQRKKNGAMGPRGAP